MVAVTPALFMCVDWMPFSVYVRLLISLLGIKSAVTSVYRDAKKAQVGVVVWLFGKKGIRGRRGRRGRMTYIHLSRVLELLLPFVNFGSAGVNVVNSVVVSVSYRVQIIFDELLVGLGSLQGFLSYILENKTYGRTDGNDLFEMRRLFMEPSGFDILLEDVDDDYDLEEGIPMTYAREHTEMGDESDDSESETCEMTVEGMHYDKVFRRSHSDCITMSRKRNI